MITVRFPNGQAIRYNDLQHFDIRLDGAIELYTDATRKYVGVVIQPSAGCLVEWRQPCSVTNPIERDAGDRRDQLLKRILNLLYRASTKQRRAK